MRILPIRFTVANLVGQNPQPVTLEINPPFLQNLEQMTNRHTKHYQIYAPMSHQPSNQRNNYKYKSRKYDKNHTIAGLA
jgi:hypothetical protein